MGKNLRVGPETRYALSGDVHIAYQVVGDGPFDLVFVPGFVTHMELQWRLPGMGGFLRDLGSFCRLIRFDKRGTGMSDPVSGAPSLETRMDDVRAVMDAVGSRRAAFYGLSEGAAMSILFAATYPERTAALVVRSCSPRTMWATPARGWPRWPAPARCSCQTRSGIWSLDQASSSPGAGHIHSKGSLENGDSSPCSSKPTTPPRLLLMTPGNREARTGGWRAERKAQKNVGAGDVGPICR
jgi:pimeloyl-ACP methyl ester carboxylesterase